MTIIEYTDSDQLTGWQIMLMLISRFTLNTSFRMIYPLLVFLAQDFAIDLQTVSLLVTMQVGVSLLSPLGGMLSDMRGERTTMISALLLFCSGTLCCMLAPSFALFLTGYALTGLGAALYQPALQSYISARTDYARRGRVLGLIEMSWALSALLGVTLMTQVVQISGTRAAAFAILLGMGLLLVIGTCMILPAGRSPTDGAHMPRRWSGLVALSQRNVLGAILLLTCLLWAIELIFVVYAGWLQADFGATTEQVGLIFGLLGFVELGGSGGSALLTDRLGKRRAVLLGLVALAIVQAALPFSAGNWTLFLPLFLLMGLCFEFALISTFPLLSEMVPSMRGTVLALGLSAMGIGRVFGSLLGPFLWQNYGFMVNGLLASGLVLLSVIIGLLLVREEGR